MLNDSEQAEDGADGARVVRVFEEEFKNKSNFAIVDELMTEEFIHHLPYPGLPAGRAGMKAVGEFITGAVHDIRTKVSLVVVDGELVADRVEASGVRADTGAPLSWVENHIYRVSNGRIAELWPAGGADLS